MDRFRVQISDEIAMAMESGSRRIKSAMRAGVRAALRVISKESIQVASGNKLQAWAQKRGYLQYVDSWKNVVRGKIEARWPGELIMRGRRSKVTAPLSPRVKQWLQAHNIQVDAKSKAFQFQPKGPRPFLLIAAEKSVGAATSAFERAFWEVIARDR